jgi:hypothetical protein
MKKLSVLLVVLFALAMVVPANAQNRIGLIGGLNLANVSQDPEPDPEFSSRTAFGFGGVLDLGLSENVALRFEPMYLQKGAKQEGSDQGFNIEAELKGATLEVPALLKISLGTSTTRPYILAGPTIGFVLSAKQSIKVTGPGLNIDDEEDIKDQVKSIDFGVTFGAGVSFPAGNNSVFVEGRYALGLNNLNDAPDDPTTPEDESAIDVKTKGIQFMVGITFPLGGGQ